MKAPLTLTLESLALRLSERTGADHATCVRFITAYFQTITDGVADSGSVIAKGLGTFRAVRGNVIFTPDAGYNAIVNAPFAAFAPIPLLDDEALPEDEPQEPEDADEEPEPEHEEAPAEEPAEPQEPEKEPEPEQGSETDMPEEPSQPSEPSEPEPEEEPEVVVVPPVAVVEEEIIEQQPEPQEPEQHEEPAPEPEPQEEPVAHAPVEQEPAQEPCCEPEQEPVYEEPAPTYAERRRAAKHRPSRCRMIVMMIVMLIAGLAVGLTAGYFFYYKINAFFAAPMGSIQDAPPFNPVPVDTLPVPVPTKAVAAPAKDTVAAVPADTVPTAEPKTEQMPQQESVEPVKVEKKDVTKAKKAAKKSSKKSGRKARYDKVDKRTFLATLARKYYGNPEYWVYIYDANKKSCRLRHPDRIAPGTILRIPYRDELPLTGNDSADVLTAKRRGTAIRAAY